MSSGNNHVSDVIITAGTEDGADIVNNDDEMSSSSTESELSDHAGAAQSINSDTGLASTVSLDTGPHTTATQCYFSYS